MKKLILLLVFSLTFAISSAQGPKQMFPGTEKVDPDDVLTNHQALPGLLSEFYDSARFYKIDYADQLLSLKGVYLVDADPYFLGDVSKDGSTVYLNSELEKYPNLMRVVLLRQFGKLYKLKKGSGGNIMSGNWEINQDFEKIAIATRSRQHQKKKFFEALQRKHGLEKRL